MLTEGPIEPVLELGVFQAQPLQDHGATLPDALEPICKLKANSS